MRSPSCRAETVSVSRAVCVVSMPLSLCGASRVGESAPNSLRGHDRGPCGFTTPILLTTACCARGRGLPPLLLDVDEMRALRARQLDGILAGRAGQTCAGCDGRL